MFETHFGLRENPFASGHQPRFVYPSHEHQEALAHLRYGIENLEPFVLITGEVGTGKTTALFEALGELRTRVSVALITNSALTRNELLEEICLRFGFAVNAPVSKPQAMAQLERHLLALRARGERAILLLDEAQNLERDLLEEIRLLSNLEIGGEKLLQIFLVGQPELEAKLSRPELRQLRQRVAVHYRLRPLGPEDTERYIHHRVSVAGGSAADVFPHDTCAEVFAVTNGIPREINQICMQAMLNAFADELRSVRPEHVRAAAEETAFQSVLPAAEIDPRIPPPPAWPAAVPAPLVTLAPVPSPAPAAAAEPLAAPAVEPLPAPPAAMPLPHAPPERAGAPIPGPTTAVPTPESPHAPEPPVIAPAEVLSAPTSAESAIPVDLVERDTEAARRDAWLPSLVPTGAAGAAAPESAQVEPPASVSPTLAPEITQAELAPPTPAQVAPGMAPALVPSPPRQVASAPEKPPPAVTPPEPSTSRVEPTRVPEPQPTQVPRDRERKPAPQPSALGTRYAAESALEPPRAAEPGTGAGDWRPPLWTPGASSKDARRTRTLPSGLTDKMRAAETASSSNTGLKWLIGIAIVAVLVIGTVLMFRFGPLKRFVSRVPEPVAGVLRGAAPAARGPSSAAVAPPQAQVPARTQPAMPSSSAAAPPTAPATPTETTTPPSVPPPAPSVAPTAAAPRPPSAIKPAETTKPLAEMPRPAAARQFGIAVGTYLDRSRAEAELARVTGASGRTGRIAPVPQGGVTMYAVVIGDFPSRSAAEREASDLIARGLVDEARVIARTIAPKP